MTDDIRLLAHRYRLEAVLGQGGMGQVWRGRDETLGRPVAVKEVRFPPGIAEDEREALCERTMREARLTAQLSHPGVITTYDVVSEDGRPYIVMELVPSHSLAEEVERNGPLPADTVAHIGLTLVDALATAHRNGIVHRDVKPSNVLLADDGRVVLTDFGIATRETDPALTATGLLIGSPTYMSPERLRGERTGTPADLWSLGATLYTALEGAPPFGGENTMAIIATVLSDEVVPPSQGGPLSQALLGMLDKDPRHRLGEEQVRALLRRSLQPEPEKSPATEPAAAATPVRPAEPRPRRRAVMLFAGVAAIVLVALAVAALQGPSGTQGTEGTSGQADSSPPATDPPPTVDDGAPKSPSPSPERTRAGGGADVPPGYRPHQDPLGFRVAVPRGWERQLDGPKRVDFVSPDGSRFVRIDQRANALPDAKQAWLDNEPAVADSLPGYQRIRIESVDHPKWNVADWEFTWEGDSGTIHVLNRGIATDTKGWAVYVSAPDDRWRTQGEPLSEVATRTFQPTS